MVATMEPLTTPCATGCAHWRASFTSQVHLQISSLLCCQRTAGQATWIHLADLGSASATGGLLLPTPQMNPPGLQVGLDLDGNPSEHR
jgi:hypothetical protein